MKDERKLIKAWQDFDGYDRREPNDRIWERFLKSKEYQSIPDEPTINVDFMEAGYKKANEEWREKIMAILLSDESTIEKLDLIDELLEDSK